MAKRNIFIFSSLQFRCSVLSDSLRPHEPQHIRPPCPSPVSKFTQTRVRWVSDAIQPSRPLSSPSPPAFSHSQHQFSSVQFSHAVVSDSLQPHEPQHARPPSASPTPRVHPNPCPLSQWWHPTISSSVIPFSSCPQSFPASASFQMSQFLASGGQSIGVSASVSVLPMNIQDWFTLQWTGWISLQSKGLSRACSNTTVQKHQFFRTQFSLESNSHIHPWLLEKPLLWLDRTLSAK